MRVVVAVCVVALIGALTAFVVLQLREEAAPGSGPGPEPRATPAAPGETPVAPVTANRPGPAARPDPAAAGPPVEAPNPVPAAASAAAPAAAPAAEAGTTWVILGTVKSAVVPPPGPITITVTTVREGGRGGGQVTEQAAFDRKYVVDVTSLVRGHADLAELDVRFDHPRHKPQALRVGIPESVQQSPGPRCIVAEMNVTLHPAGCLTGRVRNQQGNPISGASVAAFPMVGETPGTTSAARTHTDGDGRYLLRIGTSSRYLVAAVVRSARPAGTVALGALGRDTHLADLVLTPGASIAGTVRLGGQPAAGAEVSARHFDPHRRLHLRLSRRGDARIVYLDGKLERAEGRAHTDATGRYSIQGLGKITYQVRPARVRGVSPEVTNRFEPRPVVKPPVVGVDFDIAAVPVTIELRSSEGPIAGAHVMLQGPSSVSSHATGDDGRFRSLLALSAKYSVEAQAKGFLPKQTEFTTDASIQPRVVVLAMEPLPTSGAVEVTVTTGGADIPLRLPFWFEPAGGQGETVRRTVAGKSGVFLLENLAPADYVLTVAHRLSGAATYFCEKAANVRVESGRVTRLTLPLTLGGRIRLAVLDAEGLFLSRRCRIIDPGGRPLKLWFRRLSASGGWSASTGRVHNEGPSETFPSLAPGPYRVEFPNQAGVVEKAVTVRVKAGKTVDVVWKIE